MSRGLFSAVLPPGMLCLGLEQGWELPGAELVIPKWPKHCVLGHFEKSLCHPQDRENPSVVRASLERAGWDACGCSWAVLSQGEQEKG